MPEELQSALNCTEFTIGVATGGVASTGSKLGKAALAFDALGNTVSVGRGAVDVIQQGGLTVGNSVQLFGGALGLGGNLAGATRVASSSNFGALFIFHGPQLVESTDRCGIEPTSICDQAAV